MNPEFLCLGIQPFSLLDWAFAGVSSSRQKFEPSNETTVHTVWKHWIDSRIPEAESVQDEADVFPQPDGSAVEQGRMVNPDNGQEMDYEEAWIDVAPTSTTLDNRKLSACAVLLLDDDSQRQRGMVVRVGQYCQGIVRIGEAVSLERWHWTKQDGWKRKVRMGDVWMPCGLAMEFSRLTLGGEVKQGEQSWKVVELMEFQSEL